MRLLGRLNLSITFAIVTILFCNVALAQDPQTPENPFANDPCGDPRIESMSWRVPKGEVIKIVDGNTLIIRYEKKEVRTHLVAVDTENLYGSFSQLFLERTVLAKQVDVWINPSKWPGEGSGPDEVTGVVNLRTPEQVNVNLELLRRGLARYKTPEPYSVSGYTLCQLMRAEAEARAAKRGLWRNKQ